jgi:aerobic-type carbon monoxide dehydrogenase small subunit (CoxS/CutS family)
MVLIGDATGPVTTIEGLEADDLRRAFADSGGFQCGFCTPGQIMRCEALLRTSGEITERTARQALAGNVCRCTGYSPIVDALLAIASHRRPA